MAAPTETLFLSTSPGLEGPLLAEAALLGEVRPAAGGVILCGPLGLHRRANLELACANRVWLQLAILAASDSRALARALKALPLDSFLRPQAPPQVEVLARGGLSARALEAAGRSLKWGGPTLRLRGAPGEVAVAVDTSGEWLYRRGYRQEVAQAPLRETLAAGLLALAGHAPERPLWDPLCGSGTLLLEAAQRSRRLAPGRGRRFAFEAFPSHDAAAFAAEKEAAQARARAAAPAAIVGGDRNAGALGTARRNATRAGVLGDLTLVRRDATLPFPEAPAGALALANLPYGLRVGEAAALPGLYRAVARALRRSGASRLGFLAHDPRAGEWLELAKAERYPIENGGLRCALWVGS